MIMRTAAVGIRCARSAECRRREHECTLQNIRIMWISQKYRDNAILEGYALYAVIVPDRAQKPVEVNLNEMRAIYGKETIL